MTSTHAPLAAADSPAAWRALAGCGLVFVFGVPALFGSTFGMFMVPLERSMGWGRADIAFSMTLATAVSWISVLLAGRLSDRLRLRPLLLLGVALGAANLAAFAAVGSLWHFYLAVVALAFSTLGASPIVLAKIVQGWFERRLGLALGILFACAAVGGMLHPVWVGATIEAHGWRDAFVRMGLVAAIGGGLATLLVVRERRVPPAAASPAAAESARAVLAVFMRDRTWWTLAAWNLLFAFGSGCILVHYAAMLHDRGVAPGAIAGTMSLIGASLFAGNLLAGWLVDRVGPQRLAWMLMLLPLATALLLLADGPYPTLLLAAAVLGLASGSDGSLSSFLARHYFGGLRFGQASATQMIATAVGGGLAPWLSGLMRDRSGDYQLSLLVAAIAFAGAVLAGWLLPTAAPSVEADADGAALRPRSAAP